MAHEQPRPSEREPRQFQAAGCTVLGIELDTRMAEARPASRGRGRGFSVAATA